MKVQHIKFALTLGSLFKTFTYLKTGIVILLYILCSSDRGVDH